MARVTTAEIAGFAHCPDARCPGYGQQEVSALQDTVEHTYVDSGGDMPGVEKSQVYIRFADETDMPCSDCGRAREITSQKRVVYQPLSGHAQDGLLKFKPPELVG